MSIIDILKERSGNICELCQSSNNLSSYRVAPTESSSADTCIFVCEECLNQIEKRVNLDSKHWSCLVGSMWSEVPAVQVVSWRMLNRMKNETWASDLIDQMYLDDDSMQLAKLTGDHLETDSDDVHRDSNGVVLKSGDSVSLTKSLEIKGSAINAKIGLVVKNIKIVTDNTEQIEGKIEGQAIVILTKFVKKV